MKQGIYETHYIFTLLFREKHGQTWTFLDDVLKNLYAFGLPHMYFTQDVSE